jgi:hypothetical protein
VTDRALRFSGTTEPGAAVVAAGRYPVEVAADGSWSIVLMLNPGGNVATFAATDAAGNVSEVRVPVYLHACADAPQIAMVAGAAEATSLTGDLDGDAAADVATVYRADGRWRVHLELAYGWETDTDITPHVTFQGPPSPARFVNIGAPSIVVRLGGNLVGSSYGFVAFSGCSLRSVVGPAGEMPDVWNGLGAAHSDYFVCGKGAVTQVVLGHGETVFTVTETRHPFLSGSATFGAPTVSVTEIPFDPAEESTAWNELVARRSAACVP